MSYRSPHRKNKQTQNGAAPIAIALGLLSFNACSSSSMPSANTAPATNSGPGLAVSAALPAATEGSAYKAAITATGGSAPYSFSVVSGKLPTGVLLSDTTGTFSGTPSATGSFNFDVSVADSKGASEQKALQITVAAAATPAPTSTAPTNPTSTSTTTTGNTPTSTSGGSGGTSISNLQHSGGWAQYGQRGPDYVDCSPSPCNGISFSMTQGVSSPSLSGQASEFNVGGSASFSDGLWNNHLIGPSSSQNLPDTNQTLVPSLYNFTYDVYFYGDDFGPSQAIEFDINQFFNNMGFIWGHECRIASGNEWDVWDNENGYWVHTGVPCNPNNNSWNHLTLKVQRTSDNHLTYQSITLNGVTSNLNWTFPHGSAPGWYGMTINYQMDGNSKPDSYNVYLDNLTFTYE
jgi:hypothetical protein